MDITSPRSAPPSQKNHGFFKRNNKKSVEKEQKLFVYLICIYVITWYLQLGLRVEILGQIRFEFIIGFILSVCSIIKISGERKSTPLKTPTIFFFSVIIFYTIFTYDHQTSWNIFYQRVLKFSMLALFFTAFIRTEWALKMVIGAFLLAMLKLGQEGFTGWAGGGLVWQNQGVMRLHGSTPSYRHPNSFSGMAVGCLPFIYFLFPVVKKYWQKFALLTLLFFCLIIIIFTASRTGYVATGLLSAYAILKLKGKQKKVAIAFLFIGFPLIFSTIPSEYMERLQSIYTLEEAEGNSANARITILKDAAYIAASKPWGVGVAAFPKVRMEAFGRFQDTHNLYLELLTNLSIIGLIAFFILIKRIIDVNISIQRDLKDLDTYNSKFLTAISKAIVGFIMARLFLGLFGMDTYEIYWWFAIGLTASVYRTKVRLMDCQHQHKRPDTGHKSTNLSNPLIKRCR